MKTNPYFMFNGNTMDAITLYEKAFNQKAKILKYKDIPENSGNNVPPEMEDYVLHAEISTKNITLMFADNTYNSSTYGTAVGLSVEFDTLEDLKLAFDVLKDDANIIVSLRKTFFADSYCLLVDKLGTSWHFFYNPK